MSYTIDRKQWKRALRLRSRYEANDEHLSRRIIRRELDLNEYEARYIHQLLRDLPVIASTKDDVSQHVKLTEKLSKCKTDLRESRKEISKLAKILDLDNKLDGVSPVPPAWTTPNTDSSSRAVAMASLSDTHFDEVIRPEEVSYLNEYNRSVGDARLHKYGDSLIKLGRDCFSSNIKIDGFVLNLLGDMISGLIHEELRETNDFPIFDTINHYVDEIAAMLRMLEAYYKRVHVVCVVGNHGRMNPNFRYKGAVSHNFDYWMYRTLAMRFKDNKRITFLIPESIEAIYPVYNTMFCATHGNSFRGGSGWAGPLLPVMRGDKKKRDRQTKVKMPYDWLLCGHFHSQHFLSGAIMNGSMVGTSEFSLGGDFGYEPPQQAFWLVDPVHGVGIRAPVHCTADNEKWPAQERFRDQPFDEPLVF